jgi:hypothetical protein
MRGSPRDKSHCARYCITLLVPILAWVAMPACAQAPSRATEAETSTQQIAQLSQQVDELRQLVVKLQANISELRAAAAASAARPSGPPLLAGAPSPPSPAAPSAGPAASPTPAPAPASATAVADLLRGMTINALLDTYYQYNFNAPIGRVNYLRAYDVSSNNFSLNQADLLLESAPDMSAGKRFGMRLDLQFGQATQALQGNSANELRPDIYRNMFQAYGSYWIPIRGSLLTLDFGKWASSLGIEGNYTKDQMNYSRSFWFDFLPFYHSGLRTTYKLNDQLSFNYWVTNGTQQSEAFNNFKDELFGFVFSPTSSVSWTFNYYVGQEHPDVIFITNPGPGQENLPSQQGTAFEPVPNAPNGRLHILDTYLTWQPNPALTLAAEADYVTDQLYLRSPYQRVTGGAVYARYQPTPNLALAVRGEYLADPAGLYSAADQYLKEATFTVQYRVADGFIAYGEWRRDSSNRPYFLTETLGVLASHQPTLGVGLVWWFGQKQGSW